MEDNRQTYWKQEWQNDTNTSIFQFSSSELAPLTQIIVSIVTPQQSMKFRINGQPLKFLQNYYAENNLIVIVQNLNQEKYLMLFIKLSSSQKIIVIGGAQVNYKIKAFKHVRNLKPFEQLPTNLHFAYGCLKIVQFIVQINKNLFYSKETTPIAFRLLRMLKNIPNIKEIALNQLESFFEANSLSKEVNIFDKGITPSPRILQGMTPKSYIFHPTFVTVDIFSFIFDEGEQNYLITGRGGVGKSNSFVLYSKVTSHYEQTRLKSKLYQLLQLFQLSWIKRVPKIIYLCFYPFQKNYYSEIIKQLPQKCDDKILEWSSSPAIFQQIENFYKRHDIPFKFVLDQINVYTSLVREQLNSKMRKQNFLKRNILNQIEQIIGNCRRFKIIYCSSNNLQRKLFIGRNSTGRTTLLPADLDRTLKEVCLDYDEHYKDYRGYLQIINLLLFQLKHRCQQTQNIMQAQQIFTQSIQNIDRKNFKNAGNCRTESFLSFLNLNRSFKSQQSQTLQFIEKNKEKADFIQVFLTFLREQSEEQDIAKYNKFLSKGSEEEKYQKLKLFQRICNRARRLLNASQEQQLENPYSFSCTISKLLPQSQQLLKKEFLNMENTQISETSSTITLVIFMTPQMFLKINRKIDKDRQIYQKIVREALQCLHCFDQKLGDTIDFIYADIISQHSSQLHVGKEIYSVTGKGLYFTHFSQGVFGQKQIKNKSKYNIFHHFQKILQQLEKEPKEKSQYYGAYPAISYSNTKRTKRKTGQGDYTNCSWCIDAILMNKSHTQLNSFNVITFDFTLSNDNKYIENKFQKSCQFFLLLQKKNQQQFKKFKFNHKIIAPERSVKWMEQNRSIFMYYLIKPQNVVIEYISIYQFTFRFQHPIKDTQEEIYRQIQSRLQRIKQYQSSTLRSQQKIRDKEIRQY